MAVQAARSPCPTRRAFDDDHFSRSLYNNSAVYRLTLERTLTTTITPHVWHRVELKMVTEMGLEMPSSVSASCQVQVQCCLLQKTAKNASGWTVARCPLELRPLTADPWDGTIWPNWPGFLCSGLGGFEYRITSSDPPLTSPFYLYITPTTFTDLLAALPVALGPLRFAPPQTGVRAPLNDGQSWYHDTSPKVFLHRTLALPDAVSHILLKERWEDGTCGKLWDSALLLAHIFAAKANARPGCFAGRSILDLSAGTGCIGILLGHVLHDVQPRPEIVMTDLPEALPLMLDNRRMNRKSQALTRVEQLSWGNETEARAIVDQGEVDIVVASDVLYNAKDFPYLVATLRHVCVPRKTVVYLGYKRRGFKDEDEATFFQQCEPYFDISLTSHQPLPNAALVGWEKGCGGLVLPASTDSNPLFSVLQSTGVQIYRLVLR